MEGLKHGASAANQWGILPHSASPFPSQVLHPITCQNPRGVCRGVMLAGNSPPGLPGSVSNFQGARSGPHDAAGESPISLSVASEQANSSNQSKRVTQGE